MESFCNNFPFLDFNSNNTKDIEVFVGNIPFECDQVNHLHQIRLSL